MPIQKLPEFGTMPDGRVVDHYRLTHSPLAVDVLTLGGNIWRLEVPDRHGRAENVVLNLPSVDAILGKQSSYLGAIIGRYGNRIGNAHFALDGKTHALTANEGKHSLHGGAIGYDKRLWTAETKTTQDGPAITLSLTDHDGEEHFPGNVQVAVTYTLLQDGLRIDYHATTDQSTPINLTQHTYFNLKDAGASDVFGHVLTLDADRYTPSDATLMPTGEIVAVEGTPFDFRSPKPIGQDLKTIGNTPVGYDHNYVINGEPRTLRLCATVEEPATGRIMRCFTTEPGVQFYSGNFLNGATKGADGTAYQQHSGFCLETQHYPNSPNVPHFPSTILRPGETYRSVTEYRFDLMP